MWEHGLLLLFLCVAPGSACYGWDYYGVEIKKNSTNTTITNHTASHAASNGTISKHITTQTGGSNPAFGGWPIPPHIAAEWQNWLDAYKKKKKEMEANGTDYYGEGGAGAGKYPGWPKQWIGLGKGEEGFPPQEIPPWGYKAKNLGLPSLCYLAPAFGYCGNTKQANVTRWGFNAHVQECMEFTYSGCEGNLNNFLSELACYDTCTKPVSGGCDMETDILVGGATIDDGKSQQSSRRCGFVPQEKAPNGD